MNSIFNDPGFWHRLQFGFTIVYHYLFPQLTMGLAWFIVYWKWRALRTGDDKYNQAVRFWAKIFGLNFAVGVVTGIPMEFQFGTNWADFSKYAGGGRDVRVLPGDRVCRCADLGRETTQPARTFCRRDRGCTRQLDFRLFHSRHEFVHATSRRLPDRTEWFVGDRQHERLSFKSVGVRAICA